HVHGYLRGVGEAEDPVAVPGRRCDPVPVESDVLAQRPARALHGAALNLVDDAVRADDPADVHREPQLAYPDVRVRLHLRDGGAVSRDAAVAGDPDPVAEAVVAA